MPIRSGAMQRPRDCKCGNTLRQRYDEVGLPCSSTMGLPCPTSTYAISLPRTRRRCFWYGNAGEIMLPSPSCFVVSETGLGIPVMEDEALVILVMVLGAAQAAEALNEDSPRQRHAKERRGEVQPQT